jgi:hypothetical protein
MSARSLAYFHLPKQLKMKIGNIIDIGILLISLLLSFLTSTLALPSWPQPERREQEISAPRPYTAYNAPPVEHYSYGGVGPAPTIVSSISTKASATSEADGEVTSRDEQSGKSILSIFCRPGTHYVPFKHLLPHWLHLPRARSAFYHRSSAPYRRQLTPFPATPSRPRP